MAGQNAIGGILISEDGSGRKAGPEWLQANEMSSMPCKSSMPRRGVTRGRQDNNRTQEESKEKT